jgi:hypothetical protein
MIDALLTSAELNNYYDRLLIDQYSSDSGDEHAERNEDVVDTALAWGARAIHTMLSQSFTDEQLEASVTLVDLNADLAWAFLRRRKGHPDHVMDLRVAYDRLTKLRTGEEQLDGASRVLPEIYPDSGPADLMSTSDYFDSATDPLDQ